MTETAPVATPAKSPAKVVKPKSTKPKGEKKVASHPSYADMVVAAIKALSERTGSSRQAISKYILANYKVGSDVNQVNTQIKLALKRAVVGNKLKNSKGKGASGSFKITDSAKNAEKAKDKAAKKAADKKAKVSAQKPKITKPKVVKPKKEGAVKAVKAAPKSKVEKKPKASSAVKEKKPKAKVVKPKASPSKVKTPKVAKPKAVKAAKPVAKPKSTPKKKASPAKKAAVPKAPKAAAKKAAAPKAN